MKDWVKIGEISIDSARCWIGDPCYIAEGKGPFGESWLKFCELLDYAKHYKNFTAGIVVQSGDGDGIYPVYAKFKDGVPMRVLIDFECDESIE